MIWRDSVRRTVQVSGTVGQKYRMETLLGVPMPKMAIGFDSPSCLYLPSLAGRDLLHKGFLGVQVGRLVLLAALMMKRRMGSPGRNRDLSMLCFVLAVGCSASYPVQIGTNNKTMRHCLAAWHMVRFSPASAPQDGARATLMGHHVL